MPNSVIIGRLRVIESESFILGGNLRVFLSPGALMPDCPLGTSLTVVTVSHQDVLYAESIRQTPADGSSRAEPALPHAERGPRRLALA